MVTLTDERPAIRTEPNFAPKSGLETDRRPIVQKSRSACSATTEFPIDSSLVQVNPSELKMTSPAMEGPVTSQQDSKSLCNSHDLLLQDYKLSLKKMADEF